MVTMHRANRLIAALICGLVTLVPLRASMAKEPFVPPGISATALKQLADGLYTFRYGPYRSLFMVTDEGVIATDPISPEAASAYRKAIASVTDLPVKYIVYSHAHWDHARGGKIFKDEGATFIAQERCVDNWRDSPNPDIVPADITFATDYQVKLGGQSLDLYYFGPNHGTCLIVMVPRPHKMIYTVDIVTPRPGGDYLPWDPQAADLQFYNIVQSLKAIEKFALDEGLDTVIGAHLVPIPAGKGKFGAAEITGPISSIGDRWRFWDGLFKAVLTEMDSGTESFMVSNRMDLSPWENMRGFNKRKFKITVDRIAAYYAIGK